MRTLALRLSGADHIHLDALELPAPAAGEILVEMVCDSLCMSTHKAMRLGPAYAKIPRTVAEQPIMLGHECAGRIAAVGAGLERRFVPGNSCTIQPALYNAVPGDLRAVGFSFPYAGGSTTYALLPKEIVDAGCVIPARTPAFYQAALAEPLGCLVAALRVQYHTDPLTRAHEQGIRPGGACLILGGGGPMGLALCELLLAARKPPRLIALTERDPQRRTRGEQLCALQRVRERGAEVHWVDAQQEGYRDQLLLLTDGDGFDDIFVLGGDPDLVAVGDSLLGEDGCCNCFAGFGEGAAARLDIHRLHYNRTHHVGSTGCNVAEQIQALELVATGRIDPAVMITHIGGLDAAADTLRQLPQLPGGKKLIYTHCQFPLIGLDELSSRAAEGEPWRGLAALVQLHGGRWSPAAEEHLLAHAPRIAPSA